MSTKAYKRVQLEKSPAWQLAMDISMQVREAVRTIPHEEYYNITSAAVQASVLVTSDIAHAVGRANPDAAFDYRYARGHLFTVKNLLLIAERLDYLKDAKLLKNIDKLHGMLEKEITTLEAEKK